jgi:hypothetical protein
MITKADKRREQKRTMIRRHLYRNRSRRECADLIRAIRYMRLRNNEVAMLNILSRLQMSIRQISSITTQIPDSPRGSSVDVVLDAPPVEDSTR